MIFNLGSINVDHVHRVPHFPAPGETLSDLSYSVGLGGKGANMSIAASAAGATVNHMGAVGRDGAWCVERLEGLGVHVEGIATVPAATGHAVIYVTPEGENQIVIHGGANRAISEAVLDAGFVGAGAGGWFLAQAETSMVTDAARMARLRWMKVAYAAAPFDAEEAARMLPLSDLVIVNEGEAEALADHMGSAVDALPVEKLLVTLGAKGARWITKGETLEVPAFAVEAIDTTGAGDCFTGYAMAGLDQGEPVDMALRRAAAAAAIQVTREGAGDAIPKAAEVDRFLAER